MIPQELFLTKGVGINKHRQQSFELALRDAGIQFCNFVQVSSIFPPQCKLIPREKGIKRLSAGQITFAVMARNETNELGRLITASIGLAWPVTRSSYGYLSEHHDYGSTEQASGDYAEDLAVSMLASSRGLAIDPKDVEYNPETEQYKLPVGFIETESISQGAKGVKDKWTTVIAAAVLLI